MARPRLLSRRGRELGGGAAETTHSVLFWCVPPAGVVAHLCRHDLHLHAHNFRSRGLSLSQRRLGQSGDYDWNEASVAPVGSRPGALFRTLSTISPISPSLAGRRAELLWSRAYPDRLAAPELVDVVDNDEAAFVSAMTASQPGPGERFPHFAYGQH